MRKGIIEIGNIKGNPNQWTASKSMCMFVPM